MDNGQHNTVLGLIARPKAQRSNSILMKIFYKGQGLNHHKVTKCEKSENPMKVLVFLGICFTINNMYLCGKKVHFYIIKNQVFLYKSYDMTHIISPYST